MTLPFFGAPPIWHLQGYVAPTNAAEKAALVQAQLQASAVLVQVLGGLLLIGTLHTALHTVRQTQQGLEINREQLRVAQEGQITDRFTKAIEQLGATRSDGRPHLEIRLGGIYAFERIARDSLRDH
ncbi:MAG: hypothetical protein ACR2OO_12085 [Thermomicrobiales bacterium]